MAASRKVLVALRPGAPHVEPATSTTAHPKPTSPEMTLTEVAHALWSDWTPVGLGLDPTVGAGESHAMLWVFTHPEHGWAAMFLDNAATRWTANRVDAVQFATDYSASGTTLTIVCLRLLAMGDAIPDWSTQAVALLTTRPELQEELAAQRVEFMLAMHGTGTNLVAAAKGHGYGVPFTSTS